MSARKPKLFTHLILLALVAIAVFTIASSHVKALTLSSTNYSSHLTDDYVFTNNQAMSATQIQTFLQNEGSGLATYQTYVDCSSNPTYMAQYYPCGKNASAATIIYDAGQAYGMNPQVVLATMQKEQILVTTPDPTASQLDFAMGYGCADSTGCTANSHPGFFNQVDWATWQLRLNVELMSGRSYFGLSPSDYACNGATQYYNEALKPGNDVKFYDDNGTYYNHFVLPDASTASLYCYTPHVYNNPNALYNLPRYGTTGLYYTGSYNFAYYFTLWFGSTYFPQPLGANLYKQTSTGKVYLVLQNSDGSQTRYYVPSWAMMVNYGLDTYAIAPATDSTINGFSDGGTLTNWYWNGGGVFMVNYQTSYHVSSAMCTAWNIPCSDDTQVHNIDNTFSSIYLKNGGELGNLALNNSTYFELNNGNRLPFANTQSLSGSGFKTNQALTTNPTNLAQPLGSLIITTPGIVKFSPSPTIYYYDGSSYYSVGSMSAYDAWKLNSVTYISVPTSSYNQSAPAIAGAISLYYADGSGNKYVVDSGKKYQLTAQEVSFWPGASYVTAPTTLSSRLTLATIGRFIKSGIAVYDLWLSSGTKDHIPTPANYIGLGANSSNTTPLSSDLVNAIPDGPDALASGQLVKIDATPTIYVVYNNELLDVPSMSILKAYGFAPAVLTYTSSDFKSAYPVSGSIDNSKKTDGTAYLPFNNTLLYLTPALGNDFGIQSSGFLSIDSSLVKSASPVLMTRFLKNVDDGKIYYASGGAIHYVATYSAFIRYGGNITPVTYVDTSIINDFAIQQTLY